MGLFDRFLPRSGGSSEPDDGYALVLGSSAYADVEREGVIVGESVSSSELWWLNMGKRPHELRLEVHLPGEQPYETTGRYRVPVRFCHGAEMQLPTELRLPVKRTGSGPDAFKIDWGAFASTREDRKEVKRQAARQTNDRIVDDLERRYPEQQQMLRDNNTAALVNWVAAVKAGSMKRKEFEQSVNTLLRLKQIDEDAVAAARAELDTTGQ